MAEQTTDTYRKEFGPELAGELVGWVGVAEINESSVHISVALGVVGTEGAGYVVEDSGYSSGAEVSYGFEHVAGAAVTSWRKGDENIANSDIFRNEETDFVGSYQHGKGSITLVQHPDLIFPDQLVAEQGNWYVGNPKIVDGIKQSLDVHDAMGLYPQAYYTLAFATNDGYLLSDWGMHRTTKAEKAIMQQNQYDMEAAIGLDATMQRNLTVFGDPHVTADNIAEVFTNSRHRMMQLEKQIRTRSVASIMAGFLPPVGRGKSGRTWPYMDATANTDRESFGLELDGLLVRSIEPAHSKLDAEMKELISRKALVDKLVTKLTRLSHKEKANSTRALSD